MVYLNNLAVFLLILWALGFFGGFIGDVIHLLLGLALILFLLRFLGFDA